MTGRKLRRLSSRTRVSATSKWLKDVSITLRTNSWAVDLTKTSSATADESELLCEFQC